MADDDHEVLPCPECGGELTLCREDGDGPWPMCPRLVEYHCSSCKTSCPTCPACPGQFMIFLGCEGWALERGAECSFPRVIFRPNRDDVGAFFDEHPFMVRHDKLNGIDLSGTRYIVRDGDGEGALIPLYLGDMGMVGCSQARVDRRLKIPGYELSIWGCDGQGDHWWRCPTCDHKHRGNTANSADS